ncbi:hypothetical protein [Citrobacter amalonaticus]|nr:hypothetical protein [Citrobacter amalonaticus]
MRTRLIRQAARSGTLTGFFAPAVVSTDLKLADVTATYVLPEDR